MKSIIYVISMIMSVFIALCVSVLTTSQLPTIKDAKAMQVFLHFVTKYDKAYKPGSEEFSHRFKVFQESLKRHEKLNALETGAIYGITQFSDLTPDEFKAKYLTNITPFVEPIHHAHNKGGNSFVAHMQQQPNITYNVPKVIDWRDKGVITPVNDQGTCGACWAFAVVETMESMQSIQTAKSVYPLSVQEVIDCAQDNKGCEGGNICAAQAWLLRSQTPIVNASQYPFTEHTDSCRLPPHSSPGVKVLSQTCTRLVNEETSMLDLVATVGPLAVGVDATTWNDYMGGIIQYHCGIALNHAVQIVGYNLEGDVPYYIVRNSWGRAWANSGYAYIKVGGDICGIAEMVGGVQVE